MSTRILYSISSEEIEMTNRGFVWKSLVMFVVLFSIIFLPFPHTKSATHPRLIVAPERKVRCYMSKSSVITYNVYIYLMPLRRVAFSEYVSRYTGAGPIIKVAQAPIGTKACRPETLSENLEYVR